MKPRDHRLLTADTRQITVLLVDDDEDCRLIYGSALMHAGHRVLFARDGAEALDTVWQVIPDIVLLDLAMPRVSGHRTLAALKAEELTRAVPVIAITGSVDQHGAHDLLRAGFDRVLLKPVPPQAVVNAVEAVVGQVG